MARGFKENSGRVNSLYLSKQAIFMPSFYGKRLTGVRRFAHLLKLFASGIDTALWEIIFHRRYRQGFVIVNEFHTIKLILRL